jgi:oxygen-dependent protoporphyrinogen oxidase
MLKPSSIPLKATKKIVIIGAGISGLALGLELKKLGCRDAELTILEREQRPGGYLHTLQVAGMLFEQGPRSFRPEGNGRATLELVEELGLQEQLLFAAPEAYQRYIYTDKKLRPVPTSWSTFWHSPYRPMLLKALWRDLWTSRRNAHDSEESILEFAERRLGKDSAEQLFDPMVSGIYGGDIGKLSMKACFPALYDWEQQHGSLWRGALFGRRQQPTHASPLVKSAIEQGLFTFKPGAETLAQAMADKLRPSLRLGCAVNSIDGRGKQAVIALETGEKLSADALFLALPPHRLAPLLRTYHPEIAALCEQIPAATLGIVSLGYRASLLKKQGFGYLIPSGEGKPILGVVWDSSAFPQQNSSPNETRLTVMLGGRHFPNVAQSSPDELIALAREGIADQMGLVAEPDVACAKIATEAIPQYHVGHCTVVEQLEAALRCFSPSVSILGNGFHGIAVNDCIYHAKRTAKQYFHD